MKEKERYQRMDAKLLILQMNGLIARKFFLFPLKNLLIIYLNVLPFLLLPGVIITQTLVYYFQVAMEKSGQYGESLL